MAAKCRIIKAPEDITEIANNLQKSGVVQSVLRRVPQLGRVVRLINPAADLSGDETLVRHIVAHAALREERQSAALAGLALLAKEPPLKRVLPYDELGFVELPTRSGGVGRVHINDLLEKKLNRTLKDFVLTPDQKRAIKLRQDIWDDFRYYYNKALGRRRLRGEMFPRVTKGWIDPQTGKLVTADEMTGVIQPRRAGGRLQKGGGFTRSRALNPDGTIRSSEQMVQEGWRYVDPDEALYQRGLEISRRTADVQFQRWLTSQPLVMKKAEILGKGVKTGVHPARWGMVGFEGELTPALRGYYAPPELVKLVTEIMGPAEKQTIPIASWFSQEVRGFTASTDFGTTGIQLLGVLGADAGNLIMSIATLGRRRPTAMFPKAVFYMFKSFFHPDTLVRYYASKKGVIDRWAPYLGGLRNVEYVSALLREPEQSLVMKLPLVQRFARAFETSLDVAKIEYAEALERLLGQNISRADKEILGAWIRNITGTLSTARLGVSATQRDIEATWVLFSPRFTRSLFAVTATIFKLDKAGHEARLALGGLAAAATLVYVTAAKALGQEPDLNPVKNGRFNPDFYSIRVGDNRIGIGGGMRALARLFAESYESARHDPSRFISMEFTGAHSNPFLQFWRGRAAPLTGTVMDIWAGETFLGTKLEDGNDWLRFVRERTLPFAVQAAIEANGGAGSKAAVLAAEGFGLNSSPVSAWQRLDEYLKSIRMPDGTQRFPDGINTVHTEENNFKGFIQVDPTAKALYDELRQARLAAGGKAKALQQALDTRAQRLELAEAELQQTGDYRGYRLRVNQIRAETRHVMEQIDLDFAPTTEDKKLVSSWYALYDRPEAIDPVTGGINSEGLEQLQEQWKKEHPGVYERLILPNERVGETPMETELRQERGYIADSGWWETDDQAWEWVKSHFPNHPTVRKARTYRDYLLLQRQVYARNFSKSRTPDLLASIALRRDPIVDMFQRYRTFLRYRLQAQDPKLIRLLDKWGYNYTSLQELELYLSGSQQEEGVVGLPDVRMR